MAQERDPKTGDKSAPGLYGTTRNRHIDNIQQGDEKAGDNNQAELTREEPTKKDVPEDSNSIEKTELQENPPQENDGRIE